MMTFCILIVSIAFTLACISYSLCAIARANYYNELAESESCERTEPEDEADAWKRAD